MVLHWIHKRGHVVVFVEHIVVIHHSVRHVNDAEERSHFCSDVVCAGYGRNHWLFIAAENCSLSFVNVCWNVSQKLRKLIRMKFCYLTWFVEGY